MKKAFIDIRGMDCASDAMEIENNLLKVKGVKSATVNYLVHTGFADIEDNVGERELKSAVKKAGFDAIKIRFEQEKNEES